MAKFTPKVEEQILPDLASYILANTPLNDLIPGSVLMTLLEAIAAEDAEQYMQMIELIRSFSIDTIEGDELNERASEFGITRFDAIQASGSVTISDSSIVKIDTIISQSFPAPTTGQTFIYTEKTSEFPSTGTIIIGRSTSNVESVTYTSIDNSNPFHTRFILNNGLSNPHDTAESVILSQNGNRIVPSGTVVQIPASDVSDSIQFTVLNTTTLLDGESSISNVQVEAVEAGSSGNAPANSIKEFESLPFPNAVVANPLTFTNGSDEETDQELRDRIKATIQSLSKGTKDAVELAAIGVEFENKRVVSSSLIETPTPAGISKLYIDDGTGFVPSTSFVGLENVVISATGGEQFVQIDNFPIIQKIYINTLNQNINFDEGSGELTAVIPVGAYSIQELFSEIKAQMEAVGSNTYTLTQNDAEKVVFSADSQFDLLWKTGTNGVDNGLRNIGEYLGFNVGNDDLGLTSYIADFQPTVIILTKNKQNLTGSITFTNGSDAVSGITSGEVSVGDYIKLVTDDDSAWARVSATSPSVTLAWNYEGAGGSGTAEKVQFLTTNDYILNRFIGVLEFNTELESGDKITAGEITFRAESESANGETYDLSSSTSLSNNATFTQGTTSVTGTDLDLDVQVGDYIKADVDTGGALTGTLTFTNGSVTVTGSGTSFTTELQPGDFIKLDVDGNIKFSRIETINSNTSLSLVTGYTGTSTSGSATKSDPWVLVENVTATEITLSWSYPGTGGSLIAGSVATPDSLNIIIDGGSSQSIKFIPIDFDTLGAGTALEASNRIKTDISGATSVVSPQTGADKVKILSNQYGSQGSVQVAGGSANSEFLFPVVEIKGIDGYTYYSGLLQEVQHTIDGNEEKDYEQVRAAGTQIAVLAPTAVQQTFSISIIPIDSVSVDTLKPQVRSEVVNYVNNLGIGEDVILSEIINAIQNIVGVFDVSIISPASNVGISDDELARVLDGNISVI